MKKICILYFYNPFFLLKNNLILSVLHTKHLIKSQTSVIRTKIVFYFLVNPYNNSKIRSYQVRGFTNPDDLWKWNNYTCDNSKCWGKDRRYLEIQHLDHRWMFYFFSMINSNINGQTIKSIKKESIEKLYIR